MLYRAFVKNDPEVDKVLLDTSALHTLLFLFLKDYEGVKSEMYPSFEEARKMCKVRFNIHDGDWREVPFDVGKLNFESPIMATSEVWEEYKEIPLKELVHKMIFWDDDEEEDVYRHDLIPVLQQRIGSDNIAEVMVEYAEESWDPAQIAHMINLSVWSGVNPRENLVVTLNKWLKEMDDKRKVYVALNSFFFPGDTPEEMLEILKEAKRKYPELQSRCDRIKSLYEQQK